MKAGKVKISNILISQSLGFPPDWKIEQITPLDEHVSVMIVSGADFPDENNGNIEEVEVIVHDKLRTFEVRKRGQ